MPLILLYIVVSFKKFRRCDNDVGFVSNPNPTGCNVIETISILKFPQVQGSLQLERKVALDQVAYESKARGLKSLKIQAFSRCKEGTIDDGPVKNSIRDGCIACNRNYQCIENSANLRLNAARRKGCRRSNSI